MSEEKVRLDKWLWSVRLYKSRKMAAEACNTGKVKLEGRVLKASVFVKEGDIYDIHKDALKRKYKVLKIISKRISASMALDCVEDLTPEEELLAHKEIMQSVFYRQKGLGRPTKKERRTLDKIRNKR
jgi:ribosome-associated heat shock protein Hsp15